MKLSFVYIEPCLYRYGVTTADDNQDTIHCIDICSELHGLEKLDNPPELKIKKLEDLEQWYIPITVLDDIVRICRCIRKCMYRKGYVLIEGGLEFHRDPLTIKLEFSKNRSSTVVLVLIAPQPT